ncbi:hypothetical protein KC365_g136 [Hortaea werneckii]|nr:hypothetical protein KC339_g132 [Hortaea werneckii]KAI7245790.1 hypothetical protein KC365_g136 [Hortaea werneckii]
MTWALPVSPLLKPLSFPTTMEETLVHSMREACSLLRFIALTDTSQVSCIRLLLYFLQLSLCPFWYVGQVIFTIRFADHQSLRPVQLHTSNPASRGQRRVCQAFLSKSRHGQHRESTAPIGILNVVHACTMVASGCRALHAGKAACGSEACCFGDRLRFFGAILSALTDCVRLQEWNKESQIDESPCTCKPHRLDLKLRVNIGHNCGAQTPFINIHDMRCIKGRLGVRLYA